MPMTNEAPLNESQQAAVECIDAPSLVIAGAGSGKTRVLTYKVAYLLEHGYEPWNILALTFTNKAAKEMRDRIGRLVGEERARLLWMGTFHSIFARILRFEAEVMGYTSDYTIYDAQDAQSVVKQIIKELALDDKKYKPGVVASRISEAKNNMVTSRAYEQNRQVRSRDDASQMSEISRIYAIYDQRLRQSNAMDFDDLLLNTYRLFEEHPDIRDKYQDRFRFVLVDEYQDTNFAQYLIVRKLSQLHNNICVVGDDAQSVYSFRGAKIENILNFQNDFPNCKLFKLEQNYRSTQMIVSAANSLIKKNINQIPKEVFSDGDEGAPINVIDTLTDTEESVSVVSDIYSNMASQHLHFSDFAILYRTNAQSRNFEEALRKRSMPYRIYGGLSFYQRKEVKDAIAYMRMVVNPDDGEALRRVINYPSRKIGETTLDKIAQAAANNNTSLWQGIVHPEQNFASLSRDALHRIAGFVELIQSFVVKLTTTDAYELAREIIARSGVTEEYRQSDVPEDRSRMENIEELLSGISDYVAANYKDGSPVPMLTGFLENVALITDQDNKKTENQDSVTLMTIHSAKGLEFPYVYVVGMEEGLFPSAMSVYSQSELEEERRLFYVAITRAKQQVTLSYCRSRFKYGSREQTTASRFIRDIDPQYLTRSATTQGMMRPTFGQSTFGHSSFNPTRIPHGVGMAAQRRLQQLQRSQPASAESGQQQSTDNVRPGAVVTHKIFGQGKVLKVEGEGDSRAAIIFFPKSGEKKLLLKFAQLSVVH